MHDPSARVVRATKSDEIKSTEGAAAPSTSAEPSFVGGSPRSVQIPLEYPFEMGGATYRELTAHRLVGRDLQALKRQFLSGESQSAETLLIATMCRVPAAVIEALDADDLDTLLDVCRPFMPRYVRTLSEPTGSTGPSSPQT